jgi:transcriptional regulator with XRE-family HTH domain
MGSDLDTRIVAMRESLQRYTAAQPLLIVVDDAHWMDELSALALEQLVPALAGSPLRWLLTINATHPETPTVLERLLRLDANHIGLTGLDDRAVAQLCTKLLTAELDESVLNVVAAADGNPTLIAQVLAALRDTGHIRILDGIATVVGATAPALLVQILAGVVRGRSDSAQRLIRLAAVLDPPFDLNVLTHVLDATPEQLRGATDEVVAAGLLAKGSRGVAFRHTLIRQAIARTLDQGTALRLRQRAATIQSAEHIATVPVSASADDLAAATPEMAAAPQPTLYRADSSSTSTIAGSAGRSAGVGPTGGSPHQQTSGGPTVLRILLGAQLRRLREAKAISREDAGWEIRASGSKISRMELGRVSFKERDIADLLTLYGVTEPGERDSLLTLARQGNSPGWWQHYSDILPGWFQSYLGLEAAASLIRTYEIQFVPGLLQTPDYARAVIMLNHRDMKIAEVDRRVELRRQRQQILNGPYAPQLWAVIDEAVLRRPTGGIDVMRTQIEALIDVSKQPNVRLQIIPFHAGGHAAAGGPFTLLRFPEPELPDVVYVEQLTSAIYLDKRDDVDQYAMAMERCTIDAEPPSHTPEILEKLLYEVGRPG